MVSCIILCVKKGHKSSPLSSMTTRQAIMLKYRVLITGSWCDRNLRTTQGSPVQKPFMICRPLQELIRNRDKREEAITFVQSKSYFERVMRLMNNFVFKMKLVLCMVRSLNCIFSEEHTFISDQPFRNSYGAKVWVKAIQWKFYCFFYFWSDWCYTHATLFSY